MVTPMTITMVVCSAVSLLFLSLRFLSKYLVASKPGIDDAVLAFSWVCLLIALCVFHSSRNSLTFCRYQILLVIFVIISIYATKLGLGRHLEDVDLTRLPDLLYLLPIGQFFAVISVAVSKSSFILTLLRLIEGTVYWHKILLWFMLVTINASMFSIAIVQFYLCSDPPTKACVDGNIVIGLGVYAAGYSAAMDLVLTAFPSLVIWNLQIKRQDKVGIIISMSLGVVYVFPDGKAFVLFSQSACEMYGDNLSRLRDG